MTNEEFKIQFEIELKNAVSESTIGKIEPLQQAMQYAILNGGKRVRPLLVKLGAEFATGKPLNQEQIEIVFNLAISMEMIHTYSLIHDDLPAMDNDDERRGQPTVHKKFGEDIAVLAGDALLNLAYERLFDLCIHQTENDKILRASKIISLNAGVFGMVKGQCLDLNGSAKDINSLYNVNKFKTGCLFKASLLSGAVAMGIDENELQALEIYAENLGAAFQVVDDLLDADTGETSVVNYIGKENAKIEAKKFTSNSIFAINKYVNKFEILENFANSLLTRVI